jgi:hypothetical protein
MTSPARFQVYVAVEENQKVRTNNLQGRENFLLLTDVRGISPVVFE